MPEQASLYHPKPLIVADHWRVYRNPEKLYSLGNHYLAVHEQYGSVYEFQFSPVHEITEADVRRLADLNFLPLYADSELLPGTIELLWWRQFGPWFHYAAAQKHDLSVILGVQHIGDSQC